MISKLFQFQPQTDNLIKQIQDRVADRSVYTPDYHAISQSHRQLFFSYERTNELEAQPYVLHGFSVEKFQGWRNGKKSPAIFMDGRFGGVTPNRIAGKVLELTPEDIIKLDKIRQNGVPFVRRRIRVLVPYRTYSREEYLNEQGEVSTVKNECVIRNSILRAWMYIGTPSYWKVELKCGTMTPLETANKEHLIGEYYEIK